MTSYHLRSALIIDGTGSPSFLGDVIIDQGGISYIGPRLESSPSEAAVVNLEGKIITPGFIDLHSHSELSLLAGRSSAAKLAQGITLEVLGQDGLGYAPHTAQTLPLLEELLSSWNGPLPEALRDGTESIEEFLRVFEGRVPINIATLVPHGNLRLIAMAKPEQKASAEELAEMKQILAESLKSGAAGLSAGLIYYPSQFASTQELIALCEVVTEYGGYFAPHHRNYGPAAMDSYREMLEIALQSGCRLHLTHANLSFAVNKGKADELLSLIAEYEQQGVRVTLDNYPYDFGATSLFQLMPSWFKSRVMSEGLSALNDPQCWQRLVRDLDELGSDSFHGLTFDWSRFIVASLGGKASELSGMSIQEIASERGEPAVETALRLLVESKGEVSVLTRFGNLDNIERLIQNPKQAVASDGLFGGGKPHPRAFGAIARYLSRYVFSEAPLLSPEEGIRKITGLPAAILGLTDRGILREGARADVCVLDPATIRDLATPDHPEVLAEGVQMVFVNGALVVENNALTGALPGQSVLLKKG